MSRLVRTEQMLYGYHLCCTFKAKLTRSYRRGSDNLHLMTLCQGLITWFLKHTTNGTMTWHGMISTTNVAFNRDNGTKVTK